MKNVSFARELKQFSFFAQKGFSMKAYLKGYEITEKNIDKLNSNQFHELIEMHQEHPDNKNLSKLAKLACKELSEIKQKGKIMTQDHSPPVGLFSK